MASAENNIPRELTACLVRLLWGSDIKHEIFQRWNQGQLSSVVVETSFYLTYMLSCV